MNIHRIRTSIPYDIVGTRRKAYEYAYTYYKGSKVLVLVLVLVPVD